jgi:hypothetical protein
MHNDVRDRPHVVRRPPGSVLQHGLKVVGHRLPSGSNPARDRWTELTVSIRISIGASRGWVISGSPQRYQWAVVSSIRQMGPLRKRGPSQRTKAGTSLARMTQA